MRTKKITGYVFIALAIISTLTIVGLLPKLIGSISGIFRIFTGALDNYQIGKVIGTAIYWIVHIALTITFWIYGRRWIKNKKIK